MATVARVARSVGLPQRARMAMSSANDTLVMPSMDVSDADTAQAFLWLAAFARRMPFTLRLPALSARRDADDCNRA